MVARRAHAADRRPALAARRLDPAGDDGAAASLKPIFNTASLVGFGAVIASLSAFVLIRDWVVIPVLALVARIVLGTWFGSF